MAVKLIASSSASSVAADEPRPTPVHTSTVLGELNARHLTHPNLVKVHGVYHRGDGEGDDCDGGNTLVIMEYVGKANLQSLIETHPEKIDGEFAKR